MSSLEGEKKEEGNIEAAATTSTHPGSDQPTQAPQQGDTAAASTGEGGCRGIGNMFVYIIR